MKLASWKISIPLLLPTPIATAKAFVSSIGNAKIMGASRWSIFCNIVIQGSLPDVLVGAGLAIGSGGMSVI